MIEHHSVVLKAKPRGYHLITQEVMNQLPALPANGFLKLFIQHTSAAITINENADSDVRVDFESIMNTIVPENLPFLMHTMEGPDDMPAHVKASMIGFNVEIPVIQQRLALGTWQGIYLCEFRNRGGSRRLIASIING